MQALDVAFCYWLWCLKKLERLFNSLKILWAVWWFQASDKITLPLRMYKYTPIELWHASQMDRFSTFQVHKLILLFIQLYITHTLADTCNKHCHARQRCMHVSKQETIYLQALILLSLFLFPKLKQREWMQIMFGRKGKQIAAGCIYASSNAYN